MGRWAPADCPLRHPLSPLSRSPVRPPQRRQRLVINGPRAVAGRAGAGAQRQARQGRTWTRAGERCWGAQAHTEGLRSQSGSLQQDWAHPSSWSGQAPCKSFSSCHSPQNSHQTCLSYSHLLAIPPKGTLLLCQPHHSAPLGQGPVPQTLDSAGGSNQTH